MQKDFITVTPDSGTGNAIVTVAAERNEEYSRKATLEISGGGITKVITIGQEQPEFNELGIKFSSSEDKYGSDLECIMRGGDIPQGTYWRPSQSFRTIRTDYHYGLNTYNQNYSVSSAQIILSGGDIQDVRASLSGNYDYGIEDTNIDWDYDTINFDFVGDGCSFEIEISFYNIPNNLKLGIYNTAQEVE